MEEDLKVVRAGRILCAALFVGLSMLALVCLCLSLTSCGTTKQIETRLEVPVEVKQEVHDTLILTKSVILRDSVYIRDSIAPNNLGGIDRWHSKHSQTSRDIADTVYITRDVYKDKPVYITITREATKNKEASWGRLKTQLIVLAVFIAFSAGMIWYGKKK